MVFMGDVGSTFWVRCSQVSPGLAGLGFASFLVATPLLGDACICVLRRLFTGHRVFQAHRLHLFGCISLAGHMHSLLAYIFSSRFGCSFCGGLRRLLLQLGLMIDSGDQQVAASAGHLKADALFRSHKRICEFAAVLPEALLLA